MSFHLDRLASRPLAAALLAFTACILFTATIATAAAPTRSDIVVVTIHGEVSATMAGMTVPLSAGAILQLPATVRTGADGAVELRQGSSTFAAAANTELEIPQSAAEEGLIERIVQIRGNAFYNIGKRTRTRLRVETPYLVAVIKGTQFNVAAQEGGTTIALFAGHLEVRATDESDVVDLNAGEIAIRHRNDVSINVLRMTAARGDLRRNQELAARPQSDSAAARSEAAPARNGGASPQPRTDGVTSSRAPDVILADRTRNEVPADSAVAETAKAGIDMDSIGNQRSAGDIPSTQIDATIGAGGGEVIASAGASVDLGGGAISAGVGVETALGGASVDTGVTASVDLGAGSVAAGRDIAADLNGVSPDAGAAAAADLPAATVDVNAGAGGSAGDVGASLGVDAGISGDAATVGIGAVADIGNVNADANVGANVDLGGTTAVDASAGVASDLDVQAGVDVGGGNVGVDVGVGGIGVGLDVGSGGIDLDLNVGDDDDGGLLGGLPSRRRHK